MIRAVSVANVQPFLFKKSFPALTYYLCRELEKNRAIKIANPNQ